MLHAIEWHRIILDESHYIKNGGNATPRHLMAIRGVNKWLLTGTPFGRHIKDLESQLRFIGIAPRFLKKLKLTQISSRKLFSGAGSFSACRVCIPLMVVMRALVMRHRFVTPRTCLAIGSLSPVAFSKKQRFNGRATLVSMAAKEERVCLVDFTPAQRTWYEVLFATAKQRFDLYRATGNVARGQIAILAALHPARQACSGHVYDADTMRQELDKAKAKTQRICAMVSELTTKKSNKELFAMAECEALNQSVDQSEERECVICLECPLDAPLQTPCRHIFCGECIQSVLRQKPECPLCRERCTWRDLKQPRMAKHEEEQEQEKEKEESEGDGVIRFDAKMKVLMGKLQAIKKGEKSLVFTSFSKSLSWICGELHKHGLEYRTLTGSMSMKQRKRALQEFSSDPRVKVFVLTVRSGAVGITLTSANHLFMMTALQRGAVPTGD